MKKEEKIFKHNKPEDSSGYLLWQISNLRQRKINIALNDIDITYPQFVVLVGIHWLKKSNEIINQVMLIKFTKMDKSVVSSILKLLEKKKSVIRKTNPKDTRAKTLDLSNIGNSKLEEAMELINQLDIKFFDTTKLNVANLNSLLLKLINENT